MSALNFTARKITDVGAATTQCAVLPVFTSLKLSPEGRQLDDVCSGALKQALALGDFTAKAGQSLLVTGSNKTRRVLLLGCGEAEKFDRGAWRRICADLYHALKPLNAKEATLHLSALGLKAADTVWALSYLARHLTTANYRYSATLSKPDAAAELSRLTLNIEGVTSVAAAKRALQQGQEIGRGINTARNLGNLPGNICTPNYLAGEARKLSRRHKKLTTTVLDEKKMAALKMGALLSVSAGSRESARLIVMQYRGTKASSQPYVLVGKGITFDSGGISLKPGAKMDEMKFDMCGAASVFGAMSAAAELDLPLNIVAIVAAAENMPSGTATKPGDVITSMSGKTIEVLNTDAEGRLVLCDALTYAHRYKPAAVIDVATLTGACVVALGSHASALYANDEALAQALTAAGEDSHDRAWRMPLWDEYQKQLDSNFADIANIGGPGGGSITAACFLSRFTEEVPWAHLDIAGSAWNSAPKGATGRPVAMLLRYLLDRAGH